MRVLYVEDNRINALLLEEIARLREGVELRVAEDGADALRLAGEWRPDVLVLDANLPDVTGTELLDRLRALPGLADAPAFLCSADDAETAGAARFQGFWPKPVSVAAVLADLDVLAARR